MADFGLRKRERERIFSTSRMADMLALDFPRTRPWDISSLSLPFHAFLTPNLSISSFIVSFSPSLFYIIFLPKRVAFDFLYLSACLLQSLRNKSQLLVRREKKLDRFKLIIWASSSRWKVRLSDLMPVWLARVNYGSNLLSLVSKVVNVKKNVCDEDSAYQIPNWKLRSHGFLPSLIMC